MTAGSLDEQNFALLPFFPLDLEPRQSSGNAMRDKVKKTQFLKKHSLTAQKKIRVSHELSLTMPSLSKVFG